MKAISTVLQSKWRVMKIVEGLEDRFGFGGFGWFGWFCSVAGPNRAWALL